MDEWTRLLTSFARCKLRHALLYYHWIGKEGGISVLKQSAMSWKLAVVPVRGPSPRPRVPSSLVQPWRTFREIVHEHLSD